MKRRRKEFKVTHLVVGLSELRSISIDDGVGEGRREDSFPLEDSAILAYAIGIRTVVRSR
jgi:hypothetical protein